MSKPDFTRLIFSASANKSHRKSDWSKPHLQYSKLRRYTSQRRHLFQQIDNAFGIVPIHCANKYNETGFSSPLA
jgi:hypothetical protein